MFEYDLIATDPGCAARLGCLHTPHGDVQTPIFMPVGTQATVKGITNPQLEDLHAQIILANTYHLYLRPGIDIIREAGGIHGFMHWDHPVLTDSGGFQIFSLADTLELDADGVNFRSIVDGSKHRWTPEDNMRVQEAIGADIIMQLDQCTHYPATKEEVAAAVERSASWAARCKAAHTREDQALFGIVQGGVFEDLRLESAQRVSELDLPGYGIGGYSVGEDHELMLAQLGTVTAALPANKPRYLMGVGNPTTLVRAVALGVDMFDCVLPTRNARNGTLYTSQGKINIKRKEYAEDDGPLDPQCSCYTCRTFSRAYLRHLYVSKELLAFRLNSLHNLTYFLDLVRGARRAVLDGCFAAYKARFEAIYPDEDALFDKQE